MLTFEAALDAIAAQCAPLDAEEAELQACSGRVLAAPVCAPHDLPPCDDAAMDGYAVRAADLRAAATASPVLLTLCGTVAAGHLPACTVEHGACAAIMTGACLPPGADAVVKIEETRAAGEKIEFRAAVAPGTHVRPRAGEARAGAVLVPAGTPVSPAVTGLAAGCGCTALRVHRRPRVACVITGDEIAPPGATPARGQKRDALGPALCAALRHDGCDVVCCGYTDDTPANIRARIGDGLAHADMLLVAGGASMGAFDCVQDVLRAAGVREVFWKTAVKPGKPLWFGMRGATAVFNLPGNPVSALVTYYLFARYGLRLLQGHPRSSAGLSSCSARLDEAVCNDEPRVEFIRGVLYESAGDLHVRPLAARCSSMLSSLANANALIVCPPSHTLTAGARVRVAIIP